MLFVGLYLTIDAIYMTVLTNNIWAIPQMVNTGGLDYYLTRPVSSLFFVSLRDFSVSSFINLIMAAGILAWGLSLNPHLVTPLNLLGLVLLIFCGLLMSYLIQMVLIIPIFWTHSGRGFQDLYHILMRFSERPDRLFRGYFRFFITVVMPLAVVASFPARIIMEPFDPWTLAHLLGVILLHAAIVSVLWKRGLRAYSSASS
jgi:ABC-2 type transport system permease protein